ncbi:hypothetical protein KC366_g38 [Hortaea werneckii]|nr:hypothetical protein KC366_g38 [Hortaea werneckii]
MQTASSSSSPSLPGRTIQTPGAKGTTSAPSKTKTGRAPRSLPSRGGRTGNIIISRGRLSPCGPPLRSLSAGGRG